MQSKSMKRSLTAALVLVALVAGCGQKIVRPTDDQPVSGRAGGPAEVTPAPSSEVSEQSVQVIQAELRPVHFGYDSFAISPEAQEVLRQDAEILRRATRITVVAEGHCDERGSAEYNLALGERRAAAVVDYLVSLGIPPQQLSTVSFGSELPADSGHNEEAWSKNRRVHLRAAR
ncbi:MAG: peptidoglycan-associated lipoprotein Pal [Thermodesulfobacteriota bacterium]